MNTHSQSKSLPKAAVYDRWLFTLGGGEQVAFAYAETLRDLGYRVDLLTHRQVDVQKAESKMNVNLRDIQIRYLPEMATPAVSKYTAEYDVFINTSYLDYFANRSKHGILSVFFPDQIFLTPVDLIKRSVILPFLKKLFIYPTTFEGFEYDEYVGHELKRWVGKHSRIHFSEKISNLQLEFDCKTLAFSVLKQIEFHSNGRKILPLRKALNHKQNHIQYYFEFAEGCDDFIINLPEHEYAERISLNTLTTQQPRYVLYNLFKTYFPRWEMRLHGGPGVTRRADLLSYQQVFTISNFCHRWIRKYWRMESEVLYPPVNTHEFLPATKKKNMITHVGRFFVTGHSKKQLDLIKVFKKVYAESVAQDWELHFIGSVQPGKTHQRYFEQCKAEAEGFPIFFHIDVPFAHLRKILGQSKIYWHATGLDNDQEKQPILFEHFGITTVEAMASGCVPLVINGGGQPEIVEHGISGYCWNNRAELREFTLELMKDAAEWRIMSEAAKKRSQTFDRQAFKERFKKLLET